MRIFFRFSILVILVLAAVALGKDISNQILKFKEIERVERKATELTKQNEQLKKQWLEEKNTFTLEREARDKLGYQRPGETLYVVEGKEKQATKKDEERKNWQVWIDLLF